MMSKSIRDYKSTLLLGGIVMFLGGAAFAGIILSTRNPQDWLKYYFECKLVGAILGYWMVTYWEPGGRVTLNMDKSTWTKEEKYIYNMLVKHRNKVLMAVPVIVYLATDYIIGHNLYTNQIATFEGYFTAVLGACGVTYLMSNGIKYISAWANIKK